MDQFDYILFCYSFCNNQNGLFYDLLFLLLLSSALQHVAFEKIMIVLWTMLRSKKKKEKEGKRRRGGEKAEPFTNSQHLRLSAGVRGDSFPGIPHR